LENHSFGQNIKYVEMILLAKTTINTTYWSFWFAIATEIKCLKLYGYIFKTSWQEFHMYPPHVFMQQIILAILLFILFLI